MKKFWLGFVVGIVFTVVSLFMIAFIGPVIAANNYKYQPQQNIAPAIDLPAKGVVNIQEVNDDSKPIIALFYVDWCGYCRRFMPRFGEYAQKYGKDFTFAYINCDDPENIKLVHKNKIRSFPTLKIIDEKYNVVAPIDVAATQNEQVFDLTVHKYLKERENIK